MTPVGEQLRVAGMSVAEAAAKGALFSELLSALHDLHGRKPDGACGFFVPGRVELAGKHTDYAGGRSLVCAIERGFCIVAAPRGDAQIRIRDAARGMEASFAFASDSETGRSGWPNYAITVVRRLARDFPKARTGADIVFASDLPRASGMSSSSALIIAIFSVLAEINSLPQTEFFRDFICTREDLAGYLGAIECGAAFGSSMGDRGVGTLGGSEDHVAILCSQSGFLRQYSYCPIRLEREIRAPENHALAIGVSGVEADKTGSALDAYNRASLATRKILDLWRDATGRTAESLAAALASSPDAESQLREILGECIETGEFAAGLLLNRLTQFTQESNDIVPGVSDALAGGDFARAGALMDRSQHLAETLLGNQTPETIELARSARILGAAAASAFGAGFGGSVWALFPSVNADKFCEAWGAQYRQRHRDRAEASQFLITRAGPGLVQLQAPIL